MPGKFHWFTKPKATFDLGSPGQRLDLPSGPPFFTETHGETNAHGLPARIDLATLLFYINHNWTVAQHFPQILCKSCALPNISLWYSQPRATHNHSVKARFRSTWSLDVLTIIWIYTEFPETGIHPKPSFLQRFATMNHPFQGTTILGNLHLCPRVFLGRGNLYRTAVLGQSTTSRVKCSMLSTGSPSSAKGLEGSPSLCNNPMALLLPWKMAYFSGKVQKETDKLLYFV